MASPPDDKRKNAMALKSNNKGKDGKRVVNGGRTKRKIGGMNGSVVLPPTASENGSIQGVSKTHAIKSAILASHHEKQKHEIRRKWLMRLLSIVLLALCCYIWNQYANFDLAFVWLHRHKSMQSKETSSTTSNQTHNNFTCGSTLPSSENHMTNTETAEVADKSINDSLILNPMMSPGTTGNSHKDIMSKSGALEIRENNVPRKRKIGNPFRFIWKRFKLFLERIKRPRAKK